MDGRQRQEGAKRILNHTPSSHGAFQSLIMAAEKVHKSRDKRMWFGRDPQVTSRESFFQKLSKSLMALELDGIISRQDTDANAAMRFIEYLEVFSTAYPNWPNAYTVIEELIGAHVGESEFIRTVGRYRP